MTHKWQELTKLDKERLSLILYHLNTRRTAVTTPLRLASETGIGYRAVLRVLNKQMRLQRGELRQDRLLLGACGGQFQTYWWSLERCAPMAGEYPNEIR